MTRINFFFVSLLSVFFLIITTSFAFENNVEIAGVNFPTEKIIEGKKLKLNGVAILKKFGFVKVYVAGLYLEKTTTKYDEIINSEQIKYVYTQYLTSKATKEKIKNGFTEFITKCNTPKIIESNKIAIETFTSWLDKDMKPGLSSETIYVPGKGFSLIYQGELKGTIPGNDFAKMYYRYNLGENADEALRNGLLGLEKG